MLPLSRRTISLTPFLGLALANTLGSIDILKRVSSSCPATGGQLSCHNTTIQTNLCCFQAPGGLLLQTQFWDTNPSTGPSDSWTVHGLWPDNCDGSFDQFCDPSREYTDLAGLLMAAGETDTLAFMQEFWVDINGENEQFWEHEWDKHGTCMSTLEPQCLPSGSPRGTEAVAYLKTVVRLFKTLPTFDWLAQEGITPTTSKTFTLQQLTSALQRASGFIPALSCDSSNNLNEAWWYFNLRGSVIDGTFVQIDAPTPGSCPSTGIKYVPKSTGSTTPPSSPTPPTTGLPAQATITALQSSGSSIGGLISAGTWSVQTLATYHLTGNPSAFTMTSSKGNCAVQSGQFICGSSVPSGFSFSAVNTNGRLLLASQGSTQFSSDSTPSGIAQIPVFTGSGHSRVYSLVINSK